ncbi:hypothetical protein [Microtetraspora niveoalba]|uniref:hypothetical protein n=1 Tax=Microtetraspora niveoalba TaxID=46175 RepID=UPI0008307301|nr:hypothetical protein [Microtetraspora niveoalba]
MPKITVSFDIDTSELKTLTDTRLATLWHVAQANPAPHGDRDAGEVVEYIGREIIRRWLRSAPPELWHHQGRDYCWDEWKNGEFVPHAPAAASDADGGE